MGLCTVVTEGIRAPDVRSPQQVNRATTLKNYGLPPHYGPSSRILSSMVDINSLLDLPNRDFSIFNDFVADFGSFTIFVKRAVS